MQFTENARIKLKYCSFKANFQITVIHFAQKVLKVARKIEKNCMQLQNKIYENSLTHCTA